MLARLEAAVKTLSQFVADASHELRTPLAVIRTTAELALRRARPPEAYRESLQEIAAEAERMTQLVEDLLLWRAAIPETAEMPLAPLDVRDVVERRVRGDARTGRAAPDSHAKSRSARGCLIAGNRAALHRLFLVLLDNALKYSRTAARCDRDV